MKAGADASRSFPPEKTYRDGASRDTYPSAPGISRSHRATRIRAATATPYLKRALEGLRSKRDWKGLERLIVVTGELSHDGTLPAWTKKAYMVNVAPYKHGLSYGNGWTHVDGWSERILDYIAAVEEEADAE